MTGVWESPKISKIMLRIVIEAERTVFKAAKQNLFEVGHTKSGMTRGN